MTFWNIPFDFANHLLVEHLLNILIQKQQRQLVLPGDIDLMHKAYDY